MSYYTRSKQISAWTLYLIVFKHNNAIVIIRWWIKSIQITAMTLRRSFMGLIKSKGMLENQ